MSQTSADASRRLSTTVQSGVQTAAIVLLVAAALAASLLAAAAWAGLVPPVALQASWGGTALPEAGLWLETGLAALLLLLAAFLPGNARMLRLERSHREFRLRMEDVAAAYAEAHRADRAGAFALSSEFDSVRERLAHLRDHPDLGHLEPEVLELAAQMSHLSRDLARTYSDEKVGRAKAFLTQRQQEVAAVRDRIQLAQYTATELKRWLQDVEADEKLAATQMERLEKDLRDVLPALGYAVEDEPAAAEDGAEAPGNVVPMQAKPK